MCVCCEDNLERNEDKQYDFTIKSYFNGQRTDHEFTIKYDPDRDEYILYVRSDENSDFQLIPINYCPFCGEKL